MARAKWSIKQYNGYLKEAKRHGLTHHQAQQMYRTHAAREGQRLTKRDLTSHPRITAKLARQAARGPKKAIKHEELGRRLAPGAPSGPAIGAPAPGPVPVEFEGIEDWMPDEGYEADEEDEY